jgi:hypothetical protein
MKGIPRFEDASGIPLKQPEAWRFMQKQEVEEKHTDCIGLYNQKVPLSFDDRQERKSQKWAARKAATANTLTFEDKLADAAICQSGLEQQIRQRRRHSGKHRPRSLFADCGFPVFDIRKYPDLYPGWNQEIPWDVIVNPFIFKYRQEYDPDFAAEVSRGEWD